MNGFDILQIVMGLCAIPIYIFLSWYRLEKAAFEHTSETCPQDWIELTLVFFLLAMAFDFLGSLPSLGVGTKTALGQDVFEQLSHLAVVAALVLGLWYCEQVGIRFVVFLATVGVAGFACSTLVGDDTTVRHLANGLMPAYNWLVTAVCVVAVVRLTFPKERTQFAMLITLGLLALAAMAAQHELIAQWAQGNAHYPVLE